MPIIYNQQRNIPSFINISTIESRGGPLNLKNVRFLQSLGFTVKNEYSRRIKPYSARQRYYKN